jgi:hypothetical protein
MAFQLRRLAIATALLLCAAHALGAVDASVRGVRGTPVMASGPGSGTTSPLGAQVVPATSEHENGGGESSQKSSPTTRAAAYKPHLTPAQQLESASLSLPASHGDAAAFVNTAAAAATSHSPGRRLAAAPACATDVAFTAGSFLDIWYWECPLPVLPYTVSITTGGSTVQLVMAEGANCSPDLELPPDASSSLVSVTNSSDFSVDAMFTPTVKPGCAYIICGSLFGCNRIGFKAQINAPLAVKQPLLLGLIVACGALLTLTCCVCCCKGAGYCSDCCPCCAENCSSCIAATAGLRWCFRSALWCSAGCCLCNEDEFGMHMCDLNVVAHCPVLDELVCGDGCVSALCEPCQTCNGGTNSAFLSSTGNSKTESSDQDDSNSSEEHHNPLHS